MQSNEAIAQQLAFWHGIMDGVVGECDGETLNKQVPGATVTSIASIYAHAVFAEDNIVNGMLQGKPGIFASNGWAEKTGVQSPENGAVSQDWAKSLKMDFPKFKEYAKEVFANTDSYLKGLSEAELQKKVQSPIGEQTVEWVVVSLLGTHFPQHSGEIAAVKGVHGLKGLPF